MMAEERTTTEEENVKEELRPLLILAGLSNGTEKDDKSHLIARRAEFPSVEGQYSSFVFSLGTGREGSSQSSSYGDSIS